MRLYTCSNYIQASKPRGAIQPATCPSPQCSRAHLWCTQEAIPHPRYTIRVQHAYPSSYPTWTMRSPQLYPLTRSRRDQGFPCRLGGSFTWSTKWNSCRRDCGTTRDGKSQLISGQGSTGYVGGLPKGITGTRSFVIAIRLSKMHLTSSLSKSCEGSPASHLDLSMHLPLQRPSQR